MISAIIDIEKIREAYKQGCDDYIKKPFDIDELIFKIERIDEQNLHSIKKLDQNTTFCSHKKELFVKNIQCDLTKNERYFLHLLIENIGNTITHEQIEDFIYKGTSKSPDAIRSMVKRLRKKLPENIIQNNIEEGYFIKN